jgi:hypothetical protein
VSDQRKIPYTILPLESRNQESAQIPGFWIPMVKWCMGFFSDQKSTEQIPGFWIPMVKKNGKMVYGIFL